MEEWFCDDCFFVFEEATRVHRENGEITDECPDCCSENIVRRKIEVLRH